MKRQQCRLYNTLRCSPRRSLLSHLPRHRAQFSTTPKPSLGLFQPTPLDTLEDASVNHFRETSFIPERPTLFPRQHFCHKLPALERWFQPPSSASTTARLNTEYLAQHGANAFVPLELTQSQSAAPDPESPEQSDGPTFRQFHAPLSLFLEWMRTAETHAQSTRLYLAQCQLTDLPPALRDDFPTPDIVLQAGKGDVYDTNVWIGCPPTYTPLHRDPNPNLFVQFAGQKVVRLLPPSDGQMLFASVKRQLGQSGGREAAAFRGEEMMQGRERVLLEQAVWGDGPADSGPRYHGYQAHLEAGDGMFIPKGWWHSIKGVGEGVTASVNWWFRPPARDDKEWRTALDRINQTIKSHHARWQMIEFPPQPQLNKRKHNENGTVHSLKRALFPSKSLKGRVRQTTTALFTQLPPNGRIPFKQVFQATWIALFALLIGICFVLAIAFSADGKPTSSSKWYGYAPTFVALGAVVLRGSVAALLGIALYQNLWQNVAAPAKAREEPRVATGGEGGIPIKRVESLHLASRLAVGMLAYPSLRAGWIIGFLGLALTSAVQPVLQSAITARQERQVVPVGLPIYHPQFNGSLALSDSAAMVAAGPTTISRRSAVAALMGEKSGLRYTDANVTGIAHFGPVKYLDVTCHIDAVPGSRSNLGGWDLYNFTYRYPDADPGSGLTRFRDVSNISALYDGVEILLDAKSKVEVQAVMFNNTHYLRHLCSVQTAIGSCTTPITAGSGSMGDLACLRDRFINVDSDLEKAGSFYGPAGGVMSLFGSFLEVFVGKALLDIRDGLNPGKSLFMMGTLVAETDKMLVMPSDLLSHMQRVLWVTPLLAKFGTPEQEALNVTMSVLDERKVIVYNIDKPRIIVTVAVLLIIGLACLVYLSLCRSGACGRLTRDSLVHSLTVAGPNGPAIRGACLASLDDILDKAGDEKLEFGVLLPATDSVSGHLGFAEQPLAPGSHERTPLTTVGTPVPGRWYGGQGRLRKKESSS